MRKLIIVLLAIIFSVACFMPLNLCFANSALMAKDSTNEYLELLPLKDEDISVESEVLTFDFTKSQSLDIDSYSPICQTTAVYDMRNIADDKTVGMGFPLTSTIQTFKNYKTEIKIDDQNIDFDSYFAFVEAADIVNMSFEEILEGINTLEKIDGDALGYMYKIDLNDVSNEDLVQVEFDINYYESFVLHNFSGYDCTEDGQDQSRQHVTLEEWTTSPYDIELGYVYFYVIGEAISNIKIKELSKKRTTGNEYGIEVADQTMVSINDYVNSLQDDMNKGEVDLILSKLLEYYKSAQILQTEMELINDIYYTNCLILLGYTVDLKGGNVSNQLSISYPMDGGFSAYYEPTLYKYNYISSPAKNWASFGSFTINILPPADNQYVINANLEYTKIEGKGYQHIGYGVPFSNIEFSLCASETPKYNKNAGSVLSSTFWIRFAFYGTIGICVVGVAVSLTIIIIKKIQRGKNGKNNTKGD